MRQRTTAGNAQIEFALCGVFVIFAMISIFDMARGLWINHTLAQAVRDGTRYAAVHGALNVYPNNPTVRLPGSTLRAVQAVVRRSALGMVPSQLRLRFESADGIIIDCNPDCPGAALDLPWPPNGVATRNLEIGIQANYPYNSMVVMFFPGAKGVQFGRYILGSVARERIAF